MKSFVSLLLLLSTFAIADTPPPGTVKAKTYSGDGNTAITATSSSLNVNVTNASAISTVNQGNAGSESWLMAITSSVLPTNACRETGGNLATIASELAGPLAVTGTFWQTTQPVSGTITVNQGTQGIAAWPVLAAQTGNWDVRNITGTVTLPTGAATAAKQPSLGVAGTPSSNVITVQGVTSMTPFKTDGSDFTQPVSGTVTANAGTGTFTVDASGHTVPVSGTFWQATQPVSGTVTANAGSGTFAVSAASLPLPSGASTSAKQPALGTAGSASSDVLTVQGITSMTALKVDGSGVTQPVSAASLPLPSGAATSALQGTINTTLGSPFQAGGSIGNSSFGISGTLPAYASTPTFNLGTLNGAATAANQATEIASLSSIDTKTPALGQALAAGSVPVVLTASQLTTLTPLSSITVSGTVTANAGTGTFTVDGSGHTQPVSGTVTSNIGTTNGLALDATVSGLEVAQNSTTSGQSGPIVQGATTTAAPSYTTAKTNPLSLTTAGALRVDGSAVTQPVSGTFYQATQPVSIATAPVLVAGSAIIGKVGIDQTTPGTTNGVQVNAALPAGSAVIGKVSIDQTTPGTTNLVALAANQSVNVAQINAVTPLMGNGATGTGSQRVTIASDNTAFSVNAIAKTPTALTVHQAAITVGTSAVRLTYDGNAPAATRVILVAQLLSTSTANCYFGSSSVTTTSTTRGVQMFAGQTISFSSDAGDYYAICDSSSQTIYITEQE